jgi:hypothetical protein
MTSTAGNSNRFSREYPAEGLQSFGNGAPIFALLGWAWQVLGQAGVWPLVLPQNLAALGRSPPVLELEGCLGGAPIDSEVVPRRSQAARETTRSAFLLIQAAATRRPHRSVDLVSGPTLEAKRCEGRSNPRMINQSNLSDVSGLQPSMLGLLTELT